MNWENLFARRTVQMRRSAIRELLKVTSQPDMISFAGGLPAPEFFPTREIERACDRVLTKHSKRALQYGESEGIRELRQWIAERARRGGEAVNCENVMIVSGAQQGLDLVGRVFLDPGNRVIVENPTYLALLSAWRPLEVRFLAAPCDENGMRVEAIQPLWKRSPKLVYCIPNFQNPQGTTLSLGRRERLVDLARRYGTGVVEDDPYGELRFEGTPLPSLSSFNSRINDTKRNPVIRLGTFSKIRLSRPMK
jgi:2-aminoadipate transaminase